MTLSISPPLLFLCSPLSLSRPCLPWWNWWRSVGTRTPRLASQPCASKRPWTRSRAPWRKERSREESKGGRLPEEREKEGRGGGDNRSDGHSCCYWTWMLISLLAECWTELAGHSVWDGVAVPCFKGLCTLHGSRLGLRPSTHTHFCPFVVSMFSQSYYVALLRQSIRCVFQCRYTHERRHTQSWVQLHRNRANRIKWTLQLWTL